MERFLRRLAAAFDGQLAGFVPSDIVSLVEMLMPQNPLSDRQRCDLGRTRLRGSHILERCRRRHYTIAFDMGLDIILLHDLSSGSERGRMSTIRKLYLRLRLHLLFDLPRWRGPEIDMALCPLHWSIIQGLGPGIIDRYLRSGIALIRRELLDVVVVVVVSVRSLNLVLHPTNGTIRFVDVKGMLGSLYDVEW